jgi:hypothetical protein
VVGDREHIDLPMLFGGRPPGAYDPDDTESDFDEMIDDDIEWWVP